MRGLAHPVAVLLSPGWERLAYDCCSRMSIESPYQIYDFIQVQVQVQVGPVTEANLRPHLLGETARIRELLKQRSLHDTRKAVAVVEILNEQRSDPVVRKLQTEWMKENTELLRLVTGAMAFVVPNGVLRGAVTAVLWVAPMPMPVSLHENLDLALDWAVGEVTRNNWGDISNELLMNGAMAVERRRAAEPRLQPKAMQPAGRV